MNRVTRKRATAIGDIFTKTRLLAGRRWKSGLDAWSGFNQLAASERAKQLLQIITTKGLRQWTVLPFGVTNGPSYFQEFMLDLFGGAVSKLPTLMNDAMSDLGAQLEVFIDDLQLGTGDALNAKTGVAEDEEGFHQHLEAIRRVLERARTAQLRFKLDKCWFAQLSISTLGMVAGLGVVQADPKKTASIVAWPRPSRLEDVERFLATTVFIREHLSPRYAEISKPLRDCLAQLHQDRASGKNKGKARYRPLGAPAPDNKWAPFWTVECEAAFVSLKKLAGQAAELQVPDVAGAGDGSNPLHLYPDACAYGVGAGLFQAPIRVETGAEEGRNHYQTLGVSTWATKMQVERRYNEKKRRLKQVQGTPEAYAVLDDAWNILRDTESRREYDESLGLVARRNSRLDLRPVGFFSKSPSPAQHNLTTWERELLAVVLSLEHFRAMTAGCTVIIHTDHLNNTVLGGKPHPAG